MNTVTRSDVPLKLEALHQAILCLDNSDHVIDLAKELYIWLSNEARVRVEEIQDPTAIRKQCLKEANLTVLDAKHLTETANKFYEWVMEEHK